MVDTFISYSRKDIAFAKIIHDSLKSSQLETWIDWQDIPPSADWFAEIKEAIEQADTFIFIISPTSVKSEICSNEIAHAEQNNKRLIPIVIGDIDPQVVPSSLLPLNWIFFKEEDQEYAKALEDLITAITLDQPWLKEHTRIQNRALEWERSQQEIGYLLHGAELEEAERWLAHASGKDPEPTTLQTQYIFASRAQATRRQRTTLVGVAIGLVVAVVLGILAWTQRNVAVSESHMRATAQVEAEHAEATAVEEAFSRATQQAIAIEQREIADEQRIFAEARQLAALSQTYLNTDLDLALLLSIEGIKKDPNYLTRGSLLTTLQEDPYLLRQFHKQPNLSNLVYDPGGKFFISSGDMNIHFWDPATGIEIGESIIDHWDVVHDIAISPDGSILASASNDGRLNLWDVESRELIVTLLENDYTNAPKIVSFSLDGKRIICSTEDEDIWVWDAETYKVLTPNASPFQLDHARSDILLSPDGRSVISLIFFSGVIEVWDYTTGEKTYEFTEEVGDIELSPDGEKIAGFSLKENRIYIWDAHTYELIRNLRITSFNYDYANTNIKFHPNNNLLFLINNDVINFLNLENPEKISLMKRLPQSNLKNQGNIMEFNPDGNLLIYGGLDGVIYLCSIYKEDKTSDPFINYPGKGFGLSLSEDESMLAYSGRDENGNLVIHNWNLATMEYLTPINLGTDEDLTQLAYTVLFHPDGYLIFSEIDDEVRFYDPKSGRLFGEPLNTGDNVRNIALSPDGKTLAVEHWTNLLDPAMPLQFWDLETRQLIGELPLNEENHLDGTSFFGIAFSPDGKVFAGGLNNGLITFWDTETRRILGDPILAYDSPLEFQAPSIVTSLSFSKDGTILASSDDNGRIALWDTKTRYPIGVPMHSQMSEVTTLLFNQDGSILVSGNENGEISLWDVHSQQPIGQPIKGSNARQLAADFGGYPSPSGKDGHEDSITNMILSSDGSRLFTMDSVGTVRIWGLKTEDWIQTACERAGRNLTQNEWGLYFPNEPYRETCDQFSSFADQIESSNIKLYAEGFTVRLREIDNMIQLMIPAGKFESGTQNWAQTNRGESVQTVDLDTFWIDQTEVTNAQYALCVAEKQCSQPANNSSVNRSSNYYGNDTYKNFPVIYVSAEQAQEYCHWVGGRLPSEIEWEKAARGTEGYEYPWGNSPPSSTLANFHDLIGDTTTVGSYPEGISPYGVLDMAGNVEEWTTDWHDTDDYGAEYILRGGSWDSSYIFTWMRTNTFTGFYWYDVGFRCLTTQ